MEDRKEQKRRLALYEVHPYYDILNRIVRERVSLELEEMADHPSLSGDMQWALRHASKMITVKDQEDTQL